MGSHRAVENPRVVDGKAVIHFWTAMIDRAMVDVSRTNKNFEPEAIAALGWLIAEGPLIDRRDRFATYLNACEITGRDFKADLRAIGRRMAKSSSARTRRRAAVIAKRLGVSIEDLKAKKKARHH